MKLLISLVVHNWDTAELGKVLGSLSSSLTLADNTGQLESAALWLSYNGEASINERDASVLLNRVFQWPVQMLLNQPNRGYGGTNNLALQQIFSDYGTSAERAAILVMNPDVVLEANAIIESIKHLNAEPRCGLVCPRIFDEQGEEGAIGHKRYPSLAVLAARMCRRLLKLSLVDAINKRYEYRDLNPEIMTDIELCSGCFMLGRLEFWRQLKGFDQHFFMYFEDFDVAMRGGKKQWQNHYVPSVRILHAGGGAGAKNWRHRVWFIRSALRFFSRHGWRLWRV